MCLNYKYFLQVKPEFDVKYKLTGVKSQFTYLCEVKDVIRGTVKLNYDKERFNLIVKECGQCRICKLKRASIKACQAQCEFKTAKKGTFVTLTFGEDKIKNTIFNDKRYKDWSYYKKKKYVNYLQWTLEKREITLFIKRLRKELYYKELREFLFRHKELNIYLYKKNGDIKKYPRLSAEVKDYINELGFSPTKLRYLLAAEYGELKSRPHYHIIFYGYDFGKDDTFVRYSWKQRKNVILHHNFFLQNLWKFGEVVVDDVTYQSCNYVARYVVKKHHNYNKNQKKYDIASSIYQGRLPEYCRQSNRYGLGYDYFVLNAKKIISDKRLYFKNIKGEVKDVALPNYFKNLIKRFYPVEYRKMLREAEARQLEISSKPLVEFESRMKKDCNSVKKIYSQFVGNYEYTRKNLNLLKYENFDLKRKVFSDIQDISKVYRSSIEDSDFISSEYWRITCFKNFEKYRKSLYRKALMDYIVEKNKIFEDYDKFRRELRSENWIYSNRELTDFDFYQNCKKNLVDNLYRKKMVIDLLDNPFRKDLLDIYQPNREAWL